MSEEQARKEWGGGVKEREYERKLSWHEIRSPTEAPFNLAFAAIITRSVVIILYIRHFSLLDSNYFAALCFDLSMLCRVARVTFSQIYKQIRSP